MRLKSNELNVLRNDDGQQLEAVKVLIATSITLADKSARQSSSVGDIDSEKHG